METLVSLYLLLLCINVGLGVVQSVLPMSPGSVNSLFPAPTTLDSNPPPGVDAGVHIQTQCNDESIPSAYNSNYCKFIRGNSAGASELTHLQGTLTFGDWFTGVHMFFNIFAMGHLFNLLQIVTFPVEFVFGMKLLFMFLMGLAMFYIISSRGSKQST